MFCKVKGKEFGFGVLKWDALLSHNGRSKINLQASGQLRTTDNLQSVGYTNTKMYVQILMNYNITAIELKSPVFFFFTKRSFLTVFAVILYRQVTPQGRTWFTKRAQFPHSLTSALTMAPLWSEKRKSLLKAHSTQWQACCCHQTKLHKMEKLKWLEFLLPSNHFVIKEKKMEP